MGIAIVSLVIILCFARLQLAFIRLYLEKGELSKKLQRNVMLWGAFGATILTGIVFAPFGSAAKSIFKDPTQMMAFEAGLVGPFIEEALKGLAPLYALLVLKVRGKRALMVVGCLSGLGFFSFECFLYMVDAASKGKEAWMHQASLRATVWGIQHAAYTGFFGLGLGFAVEQRSKILALLYGFTGLMAAYFAHAFNNFVALYIDAGHARDGWKQAEAHNTRFIVIYLILLFIARRRISKNRRQASPHFSQASGLNRISRESASRI